MVALEATYLGTRGFNNGDSYLFTVPDVADRLMILFTGWNGTGGITGTTWDGDNLVYGMTQGQFSTPTCRAYIYYMVAPKVGEYTFAYWMANCTNNHVLQLWSGVDQDTPFGSWDHHTTGNDANITDDVPSATGEVVIANQITSQTSRNLTTGPGQTVIGGWQENSGASQLAYSGSQEPGAASVTMSTGLSASARWASVAVALKPSNVARVDMDVLTLSGSTPALSISAFNPVAAYDRNFIRPRSRGFINIPISKTTEQ